MLIYCKVIIYFSSIFSLGMILLSNSTYIIFFAEEKPMELELNTIEELEQNLDIETATGYMAI